MPKEKIIIEAKEDQEKFKNWISNNISQKFILDDDKEMFVNSLVKNFVFLKPRIKSPYNDFYYWMKNSTPDDLKNYVDELLKQHREKTALKDKEKDGARLIYSDNDWKVYEITNYEASVKYGKNTKWCISGSKRWANGEEGSGYFNQYYSQDGVRFYFFINKDTKYALAVYPDNSCEIFNAEDVGIPYIPNAPVIDEIKAEYKNESDSNILVNAIMNKKIDSNVLTQIIQETFTDNTGNECEIYSRDELNDLLTAVDNLIPDGYLEYEACANGDITPEEYTRLTGEEFDEDAMWDGDLPAFAGYELASLSGNTKEEKLNSLKYTLENEAEYIILEEDYDGWLITPIKDYTELFMWANNRCGINDWSDGELDDFFINSLNADDLEHVHPGRLYVFPLMLANRLIFDIKSGDISSSVLNGLGLSKDYLSKFNKNYDENLNESEKVSEDVFFHGSVEDISGYLNRPINWITKDYNYAKTFALGNGYVYKCSATLGNLLDVGKTDARVFDMIPSTPLKFSREFTAIIRRLNISEDAIRKVIDNVADEYSVNPYRLAIRPVVRSMAFKRILEGLGYNGIKAIEYDSVNDKNVETFGLFDQVKVLGKVEESLKEYLDDLGAYSGTEIYVTDSAYQLKNLLTKGDKPHRIYQWKGAYYFCSALGDMTHNGMMEYLFDRGYADGDGFDEWGNTNYMVFIPKNFDTDKLVYDTSLGSDDYYYCRVYDFGVMFVRDYSTYNNSLFSALGTPEREVFYNEYEGQVEITKDGRTITFETDYTSDVNDAITMNLDNSLEEEKAITWGDLDYAKKTDTRKMMCGRGTGHFGTGFYFVGKEGPYGLDKDNNIKGYDYEPSRPIYEIDLDKYNLYKPKDNDSAYRLHDAMASINNYYSPDMNKLLFSNIDTDALVNSFYDAVANLDEDVDDDFDDLDFDFDDVEDTVEDDTEKDSTMDTSKYLEKAKEWIENNGLTDWISTGYDDLDTWLDKNKNKLGFIEKGVEDAINNRDKYLGYVEYAIDVLCKVFNTDRNTLMAMCKAFYNMKSEDTLSTLLFKEFGYEGVDVTHLNHDAQGLSGLDNFGYGTVVYDLKPGTFKKIVEPRKDGNIHAKAGESLKEKIVKKGSKWQVQSEKGRNLGTYNTKKEAEDRLKDVEMFKHMNEEVEIKGDEFSFTLEDICKKYPDLVSNSYQSCGPAFIMPDGKYLLSGKRFDMHGDLAFQCLMGIEGLSEQEIENEFDTSDLTNFFTRFFKLIRVNDGSKEDIEDRAYFVIPYNSITSSQMNALQDFVDYILKNKYSKKIYDIQAFVGTNYAHKKWDLSNNITSDEIIDDVRFAMTRGFFGESLKEEADMNTIEFAEKEIGTSDRPIDGPSYIMPNGKFLTIWRSKIPVSKYSASGSATHRDVQQFLYDKDYAKEDFWQVETPELERLGCIRVNGGFEEYIWLPDDRPNETQWNSLLVWLDWYFRFHHKLMVGFKSYAPKTYSDSDYTTDEILKKCQEAYGRGYLTEDLNEEVNKYYRLELEDCWRNRLGLFTGAFEVIPTKETIENYPEDFEDLTQEERERYYRFDELLNELSKIKSPGVDAKLQNFKEDDIFAFTRSKYNEILPIIKEMRQLLREMGFKLIVKELDIDDANISYRDDDQVAFSKSNSSKYINESKQDIEKFRQWAGDELADRFFKLKDRLPDRTKDIYYWMSMEKQFLNLEDRYKHSQENSNIPNYKDWAHEQAINGLKLALDEIEKTPTRKEVNKLGKEGSEKIYEDDNWLVLKINTYEASVKYGKGTEWCITGNNSDQGRDDFDFHTKDNDATMYFFINKKNKYSKYALEYVDDKNWCLFDETDFPHVGYGTPFNNGMDAVGGECWHKGDLRDTFPVINGLPDINKAYDDFEKYDEE